MQSPRLFVFVDDEFNLNNQSNDDYIGCVASALPVRVIWSFGEYHVSCVSGADMNSDGVRMEAVVLSNDVRACLIRMTNKFGGIWLRARALSLSDTRTERTRIKVHINKYKTHTQTHPKHTRERTHKTYTHKCIYTQPYTTHTHTHTDTIRKLYSKTDIPKWKRL